MLPLIAWCWVAWASDPEALLAEARRRAVVGDFEGTRIVATEALETPGPHDAEARYLLAMGLEYGGRPEEALPIYDALLAAFSEPGRAADVRFRRAETLLRLGRHAEALAQLDEISGAERTPSDRIKVDLLRGLCELESTDRAVEEVGFERIRAALDTAAPIDAPWHQAMARARLAELAVNEAATIAFRGSRRKKAKQMDERAALVTLASEQIVPMIELEAPQWLLPTFLAAGRAHEDFGAAMLAESRVRGLSESQRALYDERVRERVEQVWVRASRYYDRGLQYAELAGWEGPETEALRAALAEVVGRVDELGVVAPPAG